MTKLLRISLVVICLALLSGSAVAQSIYATLTGVVSDPAQALVPNAKVS